MITMRCNWCGETFLTRTVRDTVAYTILAIDTASGKLVDQNQWREDTHVHFKCLEFWVRYMYGGPGPEWSKKDGQIPSA